MIDFFTDPARYKHWKMSCAGSVATLAMDVDENGGLVPGYELKLNSYDLAVDIELYDAVQRLRFEHPEIKSVILTSAKERIFCAGANIKMLGQSSHGFKVNFCKFTNETRLALEDASQNSGQYYMTAISGACAGGGYEIALATDHIMMADDGSTSVSLPELPLLGVLPGTGGLTRLVDKRKVRRDRADFFCTTAEGMKGRRAVEWNLVDEIVPRSQLIDAARRRASELAARSDRPSDGQGIALKPLTRTITQAELTYKYVTVQIDRDGASATITIEGPSQAAPTDTRDITALGSDFWPLGMARELEDAILHLRFNEETIRTWIFRTRGDPNFLKSCDRFLVENTGHWLVREIALYLKRTLKRIDVSSRSIFALIEPGSCFFGTLMELALAADRTYMLHGTREGEEELQAAIGFTEMNFGPLPMGNGLTRLQSRFLAEPARVQELRSKIGEDLQSETASELGLVTFAPDDIDWEDEVRLAVEERAAFSSDALTGMESSLRFVGPETIESKIFGRLSAWQNWIFQRPNAVGEKGALKLYGSGQRPEFDPRRV
jgi:benzoyl-CoA-dihydrodiol lyase